MPNPISKWDPERKKRYFSEYKKKRKAKFKELGICPNCEKRPSRVGNVCCDQCLQDKKLTLKFGTAGPYRQLYAQMFERQRGLCGICAQPMKRPVLDHSHITMEVRGLLCGSCNVGLGQFQDDLALLKAAQEYLQNNPGIGVSLKKRS
ncbi:MAG: endonuclease domain-containing protein [Patescibacteria group bacterium]